MSRFRLTGVSGLGPLARVCDASGDGNFSRVLRKAGVPASLIAAPHAMIPMQAMYALFEEGARATGDELLGLRVGAAMDPGEFGVWVRYAICAETLRDMVKRLDRTLEYHQPGATIRLADRDGTALLRYRAADSRGTGLSFHADHVLEPMLAAVRVFAGSRWMPLAYHLPYARPVHWRRIEEALGAPVVFGSSGTGLDLPSALLDAPAVQPRPRVTMADVQRAMAQREPASTAGAVASLITFSPENDGASLPTIAGLLGVSARALQMALQREGTSFRQVVARLRLAEARCLLRETSMSVSDIAWSLGYSELPHFTRAFTKGTGVAPSVFRALAPAEAAGRG
jgi:AraC-like DNA-binding protein